MKFDDYQYLAETMAIYPDKREVGGLVYTALGLGGEAGEILGKVKKILRDGDGKLTAEERDKIIDELGDLLWCVSQFAIELDVSLSTVAVRNLWKLSDRAKRGVLKGDGDDR